VRYGAINLRDTTVSIAEASHSPFSDDFNPSLAVGFSPLRKPSTSPGPRPTRWWPRPPPRPWPSRWTLPTAQESLRGGNGLRDRRQCARCSVEHRAVRRLLIRLRGPHHERLCLRHPAVLRSERKLRTRIAPIGNVAAWSSGHGGGQDPAGQQARSRSAASPTSWASTGPDRRGTNARADRLA
jgi:hypothetical protein